MGENRSSGRTVPGDVAGLGGDFPHHLGAHVLEFVLELNLLRDRDTILGDRGAAEFLLQNDVPASGTEGDFHGVGKAIYTAQDRLSAIFSVNYFLSCH